MVSAIRARPPVRPGRQRLQPAVLVTTVLAAGALAAGALAAGTLAVVAPLVTLAVLLALALLAAMMWRVEWAVLLYVAVEPWGDLLAVGLGASAVKAMGAVLFTAWLLRLAMDRGRLDLAHPAMYAAGGFLIVLLASMTLHSNGPAGLTVFLRYASYLGVLVVLVDVLRNGLAPRRLVAVLVWSCTAAAVAGFVVFLGTDGGRAAGPMADPNDFAFYLIAAVPFALLLWHERVWYRHAYLLAALLLLLTTLATFSRGAVLGLLTMLLVATVLGLVRARVVVAGVVVLAAAVSIVVVAVPGLVEHSLAEKASVADRNAESRLTTWSMAAGMTADHPLLGTGPGGFATNADRYVPPDVVDPRHTTVPHQMYLDVASELGLAGVAAFLAMIAAAALGAHRAVRAGVDPDMGRAVLITTIGILVAACFLSEQYYLPVWLLVALGVAVDPRHRPQWEVR